jgi:transposase
MDIVRSAKTSLRFATEKKSQTIQSVIVEFGNVVNFFIDYLWDKPQIIKNDIKKDIYNLSDSWISAALKQTAAREAISMIASIKNHEDHKKLSEEQKQKLLTKPHHNGKKITLTSDCIKLQETKEAKHFDVWLHVANIGNKIILDIPIKFHKHLNKFLKDERFTMNKSITVYRDGFVTFSFDGKIPNKRPLAEKVIGIDLGMEPLIYTSTGNQYGIEAKKILDEIVSLKQNSKEQRRLKEYYKHYCNSEILRFFETENPSTVVHENLENITKNTRKRLKHNKATRKLLPQWKPAWISERISLQTEVNRVNDRNVSPFRTSITCPSCQNSDQKNRKDKNFKCVKCGFEEHADFVGALNILNKFLTGKFFNSSSSDDELKNDTQSQTKKKQS